MIDCYPWKKNEASRWTLHFQSLFFFSLRKKTVVNESQSFCWCPLKSLICVDSSGCCCSIHVYHCSSSWEFLSECWNNRNKSSSITTILDISNNSQWKLFESIVNSFESFFCRINDLSHSAHSIVCWNISCSFIYLQCGSKQHNTIIIINII